MKRLVFFSVFVMTFLVCKSQDNASHTIKEPAYFFEPAFLDSNNVQHTLTAEKVKTLTAQQVFKSKVYVILDSTNAAFQTRENKQIKMVVKCNSITSNINIKNLFRLYQLSINLKEKNRRFLMAANKSFTATASANYNLGLPINFEKISDSTYILIFENLKKGEYAIIANGTVYSFSVI